MARIVDRPQVVLMLQFTVDEEEARALDALAGYGDDAFIKVFYKEMGEHYLNPHEAGLRRFLKSIREQVGGYLTRADKARAAFNGEK